ncbi:MAG: TIR domain-containing protein, partial [Acidimicrobiia bacterium]|nr:TIR domain-containing protein [Acidimicrobiia bacterium]
EARRTALAEALRAALAADAAVRPVAPSRTVLLCHDPADRDIADLLVSYLQRRGHAVWIDRSALGTKDGWRGRLLDVVWSSDGALFLVSPASAASERAQREVHLAGAERLPVLPVLAGPTDLDPALAWYVTQHEPIDLRSGPMAGLAALAVAVEALPARRVARPRRAAIGVLVAAAVVTALVLGVQALLG